MAFTNTEGVGTTLLYNLDYQLFCRSFSGSGEFDIDECQFADYVALLAILHGAEEAIGTYYSTAAGLELSVNFSKTKFLVGGHIVTEEDMQPIATPGGDTECASEFTYLGSEISSTLFCVSANF